MGTLLEDLFMFMIISLSVLLRMRMFQTTVIEEKKHILCSITYF